LSHEQATKKTPLPSSHKKPHKQWNLEIKNDVRIWYMYKMAVQYVLFIILFDTELCNITVMSV